MYRIRYIKDNKKKVEYIDTKNKIAAKKIFKKKIKFDEIIDITKKEKSLYFKFLEWYQNKSGKITDKDYISIIENLAVISSSGMSLVSSIENIGKTITNNNLKNIFLNISSILNKGEDLSVAMQKAYKFDSFTLSMIRVGEHSGNLDKILEKLVNSLDASYDNKAKLKKAIRYPLMVIIAMIIAFIVIIIAVIPEFEKLFNSFKLDLPGPTLFLINIKNFFINYWYFLIFFLFFLKIIHTYFISKNGKYKYYFDSFLLKIPIIGEIIRLSMISRYLHVYNTMDSSGIPLFETLENSLKILNNKKIYEKFEPIYNDINKGKSLYEAFKNTELFDSMDLAMIQTGEESGMKEEMIRKIEVKYYKKYNNIIDNLSALIEPILISMLVVFILILALGVFLPLWDISKLMG